MRLTPDWLLCRAANLPLRGTMKSLHPPSSTRKTTHPLCLTQVPTIRDRVVIRQEDEPEIAVPTTNLWKSGRGLGQTLGGLAMHLATLETISFTPPRVVRCYTHVISPTAIIAVSGGFITPARICLRSKCKFQRYNSIL